jgi:hypothetical protein
VARFALRNLAVLCALVPLASLGVLVWLLPHRLAGAIPKRFASPDILATARILAAAVFFPLWLALIAALTWWRLDASFALLVALVAPLLGFLALTLRDWRASVSGEIRTFLRLASRKRLRAMLIAERDDLAAELRTLRSSLGLS